MHEMLPAEVAHAVRKDETESGDNDGSSEVDRRPTPGIILCPTCNRRFGWLRSLWHACLELRRQRRERILHAAKAVEDRHRGCHEQQRRQREQRGLPRRDALGSMTWQNSIEQAGGT